MALGPMVQFSPITEKYTFELEELKNELSNTREELNKIKTQNEEIKKELNDIIIQMDGNS